MLFIDGNKEVASTEGNDDVDISSIEKMSIQDLALALLLQFAIDEQTVLEEA